MTTPADSEFRGGFLIFDHIVQAQHLSLHTQLGGTKIATRCAITLSKLLVGAYSHTPQHFIT